MALALDLDVLSNLQYFKYDTDDIELLAKYIYIKKYGKNDYNIQSFSTHKNGLRECFVNANGSMKSFKSLHHFLTNYLGFSSYISNYSFLVKYLLDIADTLNTKSQIERIGRIKHRIIKGDVSNIIDLIRELDNMWDSCPLPSCIQCSNTVNDKISFLYDLLCQRDSIESYHNDVFNNVNLLFNKFNIKKLGSEGKYQLLYTLIFFILYQLDKDFFHHWKYYYSTEDYKRIFGEDYKEDDHKYDILKELASAFHDVLSKSNLELDNKLDDYNNNSDKMRMIYPYLISIEFIVKDIFNDQYNLTLQGFFLYYTKGGRVLTNPFVFNKYFGYPLKSDINLNTLIEDFRLIDLSNNIMRPKGKRLPKFKDCNTLPSAINTLIIKCWIYYSKDRVGNREKLIRNLHDSFSHHFLIPFKIKSNRSNKEEEVIHFFNNNFTYPDSTSNIYEYFNKFFYNKRSKITKDFFYTFGEYEYRYIKDLDTLIEKMHHQGKELPDSFKRFFNDKEHTKKQYIEQSRRAINTMLDDL